MAYLFAYIINFNSNFIIITEIFQVGTFMVIITKATTFEMNQKDLNFENFNNSK